ncbi:MULTISPECIES: flagellar protein FliT [Edwardsiella]|uniref:Flagellar protein FliT n=2 Tax=Edwardsiella anguillarum TaxID=1821960 RepID=A0A076LDN1_9GAMM|nr:MULTISPECIES: flagellar protein FliT [Edwardsiella]AKM47563.1 repressor [Edwardsiella sp. EA181011]GAJ66272.1 flagellar protein FliT [Edwardsiella piscicida]AIJ06605.1 Flagellar biosynthesis protein FliT [Edwardsiella anguillarum ET080813]AKR78135.1 flagella biosynthesis regulatory protein FliT [Edwardsiella sp. LADL05-105]KAB0593244.1 flagella biosynthesis regulatory protein FliT [Edwardsiella anguillarum]
MYGLPPLLQAYHQVLAISERMRDLAQRDEWEALVALEMEYLTAVSSTAKLMSQANPTPTQQDDLRQTLKQILLNETHVKQRLQARMDELRQLIGNGSRQQALSHAYGQFTGEILLPGEHL